MSKMSVKGSVVRLLDRPGGRYILGKLATNYVRRLTGDDLEIRFLDGLWTRRAGPHFFPDFPKFEYRFDYFSGWLRLMDRYVSDAAEYWLRHYRPRDGDIIVDVGAGRGEDTVAFSRMVGSSGRVLAIEADPASFTILKRFCQLNELTNVSLFHVALMDKPGTVRIVQSASSWMENTVSRSGQDGAVVRAVTLDELLAKLEIQRIDFLKMNVEGAERYALPGMETFMPRIRQICVACHDFRTALGHGAQFSTRAFVEKFLVAHDFKLSSRPTDPRDYVRDHVFGVRFG